MKLFELMNKTVPYEWYDAERSAASFVIPPMLYDVYLMGGHLDIDTQKEVHDFRPQDIKQLQDYLGLDDDDVRDMSPEYVWFEFNARPIDKPSLGKRKLTGTGNAFQVFATVIKIVKDSLKHHNSPPDTLVIMSADKSEPSRISLYNRMIKRVNGQVFQTGGSDVVYMFRAGALK